MPASLTQTTLASAVAVGDRRVTLASATGVAVSSILFVNGEAMVVQSIASAPTFDVKRGQHGTPGLAHASGAVVYHGPHSQFSAQIPKGKAVLAEEVAMPRIVLPEGRVFRILNDSWVEVAVGRMANHRCVDPDTGYEYILVDCQSAFQPGEWVVIDGDGLASQLSTSSKGRVGIIVETVGASDTLAWALVVGTYAGALFTSGVTTACVLIAGTGAANISTSSGGNVIMNASCSVAPSTATSPTVGDGVGTAVLANPFCYGLTTDIVP